MGQDRVKYSAWGVGADIKTDRYAVIDRYQSRCDAVVQSLLDQNGATLACKPRLDSYTGDKLYYLVVIQKKNKNINVWFAI